MRDKSYGGPSDDFDYVAVDGLPFVVDLKGDTTKIVDRYTNSLVMCEKLEDSSLILRSGMHSKDGSEATLAMIFLRYLVGS